MIDDNPHLAPYAAVSLMFSALSNPARSAIVHRLTESPCFVGELVEHLELAQPLVSQHLKVLREAHLVQAVRQGRQSRYQLTDEHVTHLFLDALHHTQEHSEAAPRLSL
ncbi:metalloregulator ArsR/SmtB family transcription factor [Kocuria sp. JC486]|uniref:ArsR/SmtB family transcription factor n=1 Tax=Kocuria sp. JC486 TaxID=1970736 RepID=UPI0032AF5CD1